MAWAGSEGISRVPKMPRNQQLLLSSRAERLGKEVLNPGEGQAFIKRMAAAIGCLEKGVRMEGGCMTFPGET